MFPLDSNAKVWRHGVMHCASPMPLFLLRDGSIRRFKIVPEGLRTSTYRDRDNRTVHVVLDARGERELLAAWARAPQRRGAAPTGTTTHDPDQRAA
jgi:hypothetical protein